MIWDDNPILIRFWRRERRWLWLRSHFVAAGIAGLIVMGFMVWALRFKDWGVWFGSAWFFFWAMMPLCTLGPFGQVARDIKRWRRQRRLSDLMITPMPGKDYIRGFLFPATAPLALFLGVVWLSLLILAPVYHQIARVPISNEFDVFLPFVLFSPLYFLVQMLWSGTITMRLCIAFRSPWAGEALAALILVVAPIMLSFVMGFVLIRGSGGDFVAWIALLGIVKLIVALVLLAGMSAGFVKQVNVEEW